MAMKKTLITTTALATFAVASVLPLHAEEAGEKKTSAGAELAKTERVESGTYRGTAHKVDPTEEEIYFKTEDGKLIELYLKDDTKITKGDQEAEFKALEEGQKLEVRVEKDGDKLKPLQVTILE